MSSDSRKDARDRGLQIRREVLGDKYVDAAMNNMTDFNRPLQELLNEHCWGGPWAREGLTRKERSMINLAMLTALGRTHEVETHVRGALNNGLTHPELFGYVGVFSMGLQNPQQVADYDAKNGAALDKAGKSMKLVYYAVGKADFLYQSVAPTRAMFAKHGIKDVYNESEGGHTWINWRHYLGDLAPKLFQ